MGFKEFIADLFGSQIKDENGNVLGTIVGQQATEVYYKELAISMSINLIANSISQCTIRTYENNKEVFGQNHYILNIRPNANQNSSQLWHKVVEHMVYDGEALIVNVQGCLYVADTYSVDEYPIKGNVYSNVTIGNLSLSRKFKQSDVIVLKLSDTNIKRLIDSLYNSYGELLEYCIERYKINNQQKYILEMENVKAGDKQFNDKFMGIMQEQLKSFLDNQVSVLPLYKGQTLTDISKTENVSSNDFQLLVEQLFKIVAQAFSIPLDLLFGKTDNIKQVTQQYLTFCVEPITSMISEELSAKLYDGFEGFTRGSFCKVDTSDIRHIDILEMANAVDKILASGILCINEIRTLVGFNEIDEEYANMHFMTKNYTLANSMLEEDKENNEVDIIGEPSNENDEEGGEIDE